MDQNYWNNQYRQLSAANVPAATPTSAVRGYELTATVLDQAAALSGMAGITAPASGIVSLMY